MIACVLLSPLAASNNLSASVTVTKVGQDLRVVGNGQRDEVLITDGPGDTVRVVGRNGTQVNGTGNGTVDTSGPFRDVVVELNGGNDFALCNGLTRVRRRLDVIAGPGNDRVSVLNSDLNTCRPITAGGRDRVVVSNCSIRGLLLIPTGGGADTVFVSDTVIGNRTRVQAGIGTNTAAPIGVADCVKFERVTVNDDLTILTGNGPDTVVLDSVDVTGELLVAVNAGDDGVRASGSTFQGEVRALLGNGDDGFLAENFSVFEGDVEIVGLGGDDSIAVSSAACDRNLVVLGGGNQDVFLSVQSQLGSSAMHTIDVDGLGGNDTVFSYQSIFDAVVDIDGGDGFDLFHSDGDIFNEPVFDNGFEGSAENFDWQTLLAFLQMIDC